MNFDKYFSNLPAELGCSGAVEEYKLLALYAYNAYFNADSLKTEELLDSITFSRENKYNIDGVFVNETLDEDTLEVVFSYYVGDGMFSTGTAINAIQYIAATLNDLIVRKYNPGHNKKAEDLVNELFTEILDNKNVIIRIITDYAPNASETYEITKQIESLTFNFKKAILSSTISFGQDILQVVESNKEPYDSVKEGKLIMDDANNMLKYADNSFICNISALSLKDLWDKEGTRGLLAMNLRYYIKAGNIDEKIENSILFDQKDFWYLNNGIIIVCDDYNIVDNELRMSNFSIVNGGQTTRMIGKIPFEKDFYISCKVVKNTFETSQEKNIFVSKVAEASNTQKPIKAKDIIANRPEQRDLKTLMSEHNVFIEIKRGEKCDTKVFTEPWQRTKNNELAQDLYSFVYMEPGPTRNNVSKLLQNEEKYKIMFVDHKYDFEFLKSLLFLEKAFRQYKKKIEKDDGVDAIKKGLVKNGQFYCMAIIGYILKLVYNNEYYANMEKYRNNNAMYNLYSPELAFNHGFIKDNLSYKEFYKISEKVFDYVFDSLMRPSFEYARQSNAALAYSNWTKSNTGFNQIRTAVNFMIFDNNDPMKTMDTFRHLFKEIDNDQMDSNIDMYVDYCKSNKEIKAKDQNGNELNEKDEELRNALMVYRLNKANEKHISETKIFTDKMLDKLVLKKPMTIPELKKIVSPLTAYECGEDILKIIQENM